MQFPNLAEPVLSRLVGLLRQEPWGGDAGVLVLDDDEDCRDVIAEVLRLEGCEVRTAATVAEGLLILAEWVPSLILLDLFMPQMDGHAFARAYHAQPGPHAPLILLTASREREQEAEAMGAVGSIEKPFELDQFLTVVSQYAPCVDEPTP